MRGSAPTAAMVPADRRRVPAVVVSVAAARGHARTRVTVPLVLGSSRPGAGWPAGVEAQPSVELGSLLHSGCYDVAEGEVSRVGDKSEEQSAGEGRRHQQVWKW